MKVYLAAPWVFKEDMKAVQDQWEAAGFEVTSHWIKFHPSDDIDKDFAALQQEAVQDLQDVDAADVLVIYNLGKSEGKATELGYAYRGGKQIFLIGERTINIFYRLPGVAQFESTEEAIFVLTPRRVS